MKKQLLAVAAMAVAVTVWPRKPVQAQPERLGDAQTILLRFGVTDKTGKNWTGTLEPDSADSQVLSLRGYHFQPPDRVQGNRFEFATRAWAPAFVHVDLSAARPGPQPVLPNGVYALVKGSRFRLVVDGASYPFRAQDQALAGGNIEVETVPTEMQLTGAGSGEADFPAVAAGPNGRAAVVWQEYMGEKDRLAWREFDGKSWQNTEVLDVPQTLDIFRTAAAYDGQGALHLVWSAQVDGNWDLYERRGAAVERLTDAPGTDFHHKLIADARGDLWLAWQAFRGGQSDIYLRRFSGGRWGPEMKVSESRANDWEPSLAAAPDGKVWVAWDSYDHGNYDIFVRSYTGDSPGPVRAITRSPRFQAHASITADAQSRLWIAFDEAEVNWGKDYGYLWKDRGNPLYQTRRIRIARLSGDKLEEPAAPIEDAPDFLQYPQIQVTPGGALQIVALQLTHADRVLEVWGARGVWDYVLLTLDGAGWKRGRVLPSSNGAHDMRAAIAPGWVAWASDGRNFGPAAPQRQTVHVAQASGLGGLPKMKPFEEQPELAFPTHPQEPADIQRVRQYRIGKNRIFRGDLHRHTSLSGDGVGDGSLWDFYRYMLDAADMDMSTVTDHQGGGTAYNWWKAQKSTDLYFMPGRLTSIYAYERSVPYPNGHRNIVFPKRGGPILPIPPDERDGKTRSADAVLPYLRQYNAIAFRHTIATNQGTDWQDHSNELEPLVEIYQGHRVVYEHEGGPKGATAEKLYLQRSGYRPAGFLWNALARGYRMGIQASSDHCSTHVSYACVISESDSREALIDAMRKRHTFGATDNIVVDFRVRANGREYLQGDEIRADGRYSLWVNVIGTAPIQRIDVIRNERYVYAVTPTGKSAASFTYTDPDPARGEKRYYIRLMQENGHLAWSSPVWVEMQKPGTL